MNVYVRHLAQALAAAGHHVDLVTLWRRVEHPHQSPSQRPWTWSQLADGLRLLEITLPQTVDATKDELPAHLDLITETVESAYRHAGDVKPDVVHSHYWLSACVGASLAETWGVPAVATLHTTALAKNQRAGADEAQEPQARADGEAAIIRQAAGIVVNTESEGESLVELYGASAHTIRVIAPGVDTAIFHPVPDPGRHASTNEDDHQPGADPSSAKERAFTIGFAGRLQSLKGPQILVQAVSALQSVRPHVTLRLWLAGVGPTAFTEHLHQLIEQHGLEGVTELTGSISVQELAQRFRDSDVVAVPSSSETFGLVALEAQACGTPVVATDVDGLRHAVEDGVTGWLVPDRTPTTWAEALACIADDAEEREKRGRAAAQRAQKFSWEANALTHAHYYRQLLAQRAVG